LFFDFKKGTMPLSTSMILFLYGEDTLRSQVYVRQSIEKFRRERDPQGYNTARLDAKTADTGNILAEITSAPFLAQKRMVVIENIASTTNKELVRAFGERLDAGIPESTIVVIWQHEPVGKAKESKELFERLKQEKYAQEFEALTGETLTAWIKKEIATAGGTIEPGAVSAISALGGKDMWLMSGVLAQLTAYARGRAITASDVALFVPEKLDDNVFSLVEALVSGNRKKASLLMFEQRRLGQDDMRLFSLIAWQFRVLVALSDAMLHEPGIPSDILAKQLEIHPFVVKKNLPLIKRFSHQALLRIHDELVAIDRATKNGRASQGLLLDRLVEVVAVK
jgi:DNA polymerase-3 subunit delta